MSALSFHSPVLSRVLPYSLSVSFQGVALSHRRRHRRRVTARTTFADDLDTAQNVRWSRYGVIVHYGTAARSRGVVLGRP